MTGHTRRRTQDERRALAEHSVLTAAIALIAEEGSRAVTVARVGENAGYSRGIVGHHFGNRENLLRRIVEHLADVDLPAYDGNGLDQLVTTAETYLGTVASGTPSTRAFLRMWSEAIASDPVLEPLFAAQDVQLRTRLAEIVQSGIDDGSIRATVDVAASAAFVAATLRGLGMQMIATPPIGPARTVISETTDLIRSAFGAVGT